MKRRISDQIAGGPFWCKVGQGVGHCHILWHLNSFSSDTHIDSIEVKMSGKSHHLMAVSDQVHIMVVVSAKLFWTKTFGYYFDFDMADDMML